MHLKDFQAIIIVQVHHIMLIQQEQLKLQEGKVESVHQPLHQEPLELEAMVLLYMVEEEEPVTMEEEPDQLIVL